MITLALFEGWVIFLLCVWICNMKDLFNSNESLSPAGVVLLGVLLSVATIVIIIKEIEKEGEGQ